MSREDGKGNCVSCDRIFSYYLIHNGFNNSAYLYCDRCGETCLLDLWSLPHGVEITDYGIIPNAIEQLLKPCQCGGTFRKEAAPRCPHCNSTLSAVGAKEYIEANAHGTISGWRWQQTWDGLYCIVIDGKVSKDCWKSDVETRTSA